MTAPTVDYFGALCHGLHVQPNQKGEVWLTCPNCGKDANHFSFSANGAFCFVCGYKPALRKLAEILLGGLVIAPMARPAPAPPRPRPWQSQANVLAASFAETPGTLQAWQRYKPVPIDVIRARQLGLGAFPGGLWDDRQRMRCHHPRLIVPLFSGRDVVGFRCRAIDCRCAKWLSPGGSQMVLYNAEYIRRSEALTVVENPIDALLIERLWGEVAVATLGVTIWKDGYTDQVRQAAPRMTLAAFDSDQPGRDGAKRLVGKLLAVGIRAAPFDWSLYPGFKDIGEFFSC